jgi:GcrA cell cycle regulator
MSADERSAAIRDGVASGLQLEKLARLHRTAPAAIETHASRFGIPIVAVEPPKAESVAKAPAEATVPGSVFAQPPRSETSAPRSWAAHRRTRGEWPDERIKELKRLHGDGHSAAEIARQMGGGLTRSSILGKLRRLGITSGHPTSAPRTRRPVAARPRRPRPIAPKTPTQPRPPTPPARVTPLRTDIPEPPSRGLTLMGLESADCKWPSGDVAREMTFCGAPRFMAIGSEAPPSPYCEHHTARAYPPRIVRDRLDRRLAR